MLFDCPFNIECRRSTTFFILALTLSKNCSVWLWHHRNTILQTACFKLSAILQYLLITAVTRQFFAVFNDSPQHSHSLREGPHWERSGRGEAAREIGPFPFARTAGISLALSLSSLGSISTSLSGAHSLHTYCCQQDAQSLRLAFWSL